MSSELLVGLVTALVGLIGAHWGYCVGKDQANIERQKLRHDLYDRRMTIVRATMEFIAGIVHEGKTDWPRIVEFNRATQESFFLFGSEIHDYLHEMHKKAVDLMALNEKLHHINLPIGKERTEAAHENAKLAIWFGDQFDEARKKFAKHMSLTE